MAANGREETVVCAVCGEPAALAMTAECNWCDRRYHLNQRNDVEGKDCGQVWIDEQHLALQFACNDCLAAQGMAADAKKPPARREVQVPGRRRYRKRK
jgi:hypothetical protein